MSMPGKMPSPAATGKAAGTNALFPAKDAG
jgi:hypothetical protein